MIKNIVSALVGQFKERRDDMLDQAEREKLEKGMMVLWIIWGAMLVSLGIYILVCYFLGQQYEPAVSENFPFDMMKNILYVISLATFILIHFLRKQMTKMRPSGPLPSAAEDPEAHPAIGKYAVAFIVSMALADSIGIYGVVLFLLSLNYKVLYTFVLISAATMVFYRPKLEELGNMAIALKEAQ